MSNPLSPSANRTGLDLWIHAAEMSRQAYGTPGTWAVTMAKAGWTTSGFLSPGVGFQAEWAYSAALSRLEITCRGSSQVYDYILDALSWIRVSWRQLPRDWRVSYGMVRGPRKAWPCVADLIDHFRPKMIDYSGHSKGVEAVLLHAATMELGLATSCVAIEPPRIFSPHTRDLYRLKLAETKSSAVVVINTQGRSQDVVTLKPVTLRHGPDLVVLGHRRVFEGNNAVSQWHDFKAATPRTSWRRWLRGRYGAHGLDGVIEHMESLRGPRVTW